MSIWERLARLLRAWPLALVAVLFTLPVQAQDDADDGETDDEDRVEEIVVTGSRIKRSEFNSAAPLAIITSERSQLAGLLDTSDILQNSTIASGQQINDSFSGFVPAGGPGANTISLRGLGAQRTLFLVNGKRWGPSGLRGSTSSVDLTAVPQSAISRYEILKDSASSVYGADAVAGVVNAITKERVDGGQVNATGFLPGATGGEAYGVDAIWGRVSDNWSFNISGSYGKQQKMVATDRNWSYCDIRPRVTDQDMDGVIDNTHPDTGVPLCFGFLYGDIHNAGLRYEPSLSDPTDASNPFYDPFWGGSLQVPYYTEVGAGPLANENQFFYRDTRSPGIRNIISEGEIYSVNSFGDFDFSIADRTATAYYEFYWNRRESTLNGGYRQFFPVVPASNPYNPIGNFASPEFLAFFGGGFPAQVVLPSYELQDPETVAEIDRYNAFVGLKGDLSESWTYDAYFGFSDSDGTYASESWLNDRVNASINAVDDGSGNIVCADLVAFPDCVAPNFFVSSAMLDGDLPAWRNFVGKRTVGSTTYKSRQFAAYATGDLFEMPAGTAAMVIGGEVRREEINDVPDIDAQNDNIWGSSTAEITAGKDTVTEAYAELELPIVKDGFLAQSMVLNTSYRWTDYETYGDDTTFRLAFDWQVNDWVRLRATKGTSFRAPDLFEQFLGNQTGFVNGFIDPCTNYGSLYDSTSAIFLNCQSEGLPPDFGGTTSSPRSITGGNTELLAETSDSWTGGIVLTPGETGLSIAASWFNIELENTVASPSVNFVVGDCYTSANFSSPWCSRIAPRDALDNLTDIDASLLNVGLERSKGIDFDVLYQKEFSTFDLTIDASATHMMVQDQNVLGQYDQILGRWAYPDWAAEGDLQIDVRDWTFFWSVQWIGNQSEDPVYDPGTTRPDRPVSTGTRTYNHVSARYTASEWQIIATIRNVLDRDPPIVADGAGSFTANRIYNTLPAAGYNLRGRTFIVQASMRFDL